MNTGASDNGQRYSRLEAPIFIVGHPRSGTSLLAAILGRHSRLTATPETHYFNEVRYSLAPHFAAGPGAVAKRLATTRMRHLPLTNAETTAALASAEMNIPGVFEALMLAILAKTKSQRIVEKTPVHIRHIDDIINIWDDAKILWIVRDGRACASSLRKLDWASDNLTTLARQWNRNMRFALAAENRNQANVIRISYEALVTDPSETLGFICDRLGEAFEPEMMNNNLPANSVSEFESGWKSNVNAPMLCDRQSAWRQELDASEQVVIERIMGPVLSKLGYDVTETLSTRAVFERMSDRMVNSKFGLPFQMFMYDLNARRRFAPDHANQSS